MLAISKVYFNASLYFSLFNIMLVYILLYFTIILGQAPYHKDSLYSTIIGLHVYNNVILFGVSMVTIMIALKYFSIVAFYCHCMKDYLLKC